MRSLHVSIPLPGMPYTVHLADWILITIFLRVEQARVIWLPFVSGLCLHKGEIMAIIRVMTFNIHGSDPEWAALHADLTLGVIRRYSPDILGLQEVAVPNIEFYRQHLTDYEYELGQK